jgi:L-Ala-D/L-Glu epimerase
MHTPTIRDVAVYRFDLRLKRQLRISSMALEHAANLLVKITSSDGICGWGEASPFH